MKSSTCLIPIFVGLAATLSAEVPRKAPITRYTRLWTDSLFTSKPPPVGQGPVNNPLDDYTLTGVAPIKDGYRITIMDRKNPDQRKVIDSTNPSAEFKVISVNRTPGEALSTVVRLSIGSSTGTVRFEPELLTLKAAPIQQPVQNQANLPPGVTNDANNQNQNGRGNRGDRGNRREPRPRVVPPPTNNQGQNNNGQQQQTQGRPSRR